MFDSQNIRDNPDAWNAWIKTVPRFDPRQEARIVAEWQESGSDVDQLYSRLAPLAMGAFGTPTISLTDADFGGAQLPGIDFQFVNLSRARFFEADLSHADFLGADLSGADFRFARLRGANLRHANLVSAVFSQADLDDADLGMAQLGMTTFAFNDLRATKGLNTTYHYAPSYFDIGTMLLSTNAATRSFFETAGVASGIATYLDSFVTTPVQFHSCFISYASADQEFARRLYADLRRAGIRCWFAPESLRIGDKVRATIDQSIRLHDKLLLILSSQSLDSQWVEHEVESALAAERDESRTVLFPVRLDDKIMKVTQGWAALVRNTRHIGDFIEWRDTIKYAVAFTRLKDDLRLATQAT